MNALSLLSLQFLSLSLSFGVLQLVVTTFVTKIIYFNLINIFFLTIKSKVCFSSCSYCWCLSLKCRMMYVQRLTLEGCFALILQGCKGLVQRWVWSEQGPWGRGLPPPHTHTSRPWHPFVGLQKPISVGTTAEVVFSTSGKVSVHLSEGSIKMAAVNTHGS